MVVRDFSLFSEQEIRRDEPLRTLELAFSTVHLPDHGPPLEVGIGARFQAASTDRAEVKPVTVAERDRSGFEKAPVVVTGDFGLENGVMAGQRFELRLDPVPVDQRPNLATRRLRGGLEDPSGLIRCTRFALEA
jgi:hypothetical protein